MQTLKEALYNRAWELEDRGYETKCLIWNGAKDNYGYGQVRAEGRGWKAHRASYKVFVGELHEGLSVLHRCDQRDCFRPDHLYEGTQAENMAEKKERGRSARGERQHLAKLTEADVRAIKVRIAGGEILRVIAEDFGVAKGTVGSIKRGQSWGWVE